MSATKTVKPTIPLATGQALAAKLVEAFSPHCDRIEVAGSIRRKRPEIGDVELVAIPKLGRDLFGEPDPKRDFLADYLEELVATGKIFKTPSDRSSYTTAWGERYKKFWVKVTEALGEIQVDLFLATTRNWGAIFTIRTGPAEFSQALVTRIKQQTPYRQQEGYLVNQETGEIAATPEEADYFRLAGVGWVEPSRRSAEVLRAVPGREPDSLTGNISSEEALSTRLLALLREQIRPTHKTAIRMRLRAERAEFDTVVRSLILLGEIEEHDYRLRPAGQRYGWEGLQESLNDRLARTSMERCVLVPVSGNISSGIVYTTDEDVRAAIRARLERRAGIA